MGMSKKDFIALADALRGLTLDDETLAIIVAFCKRQNSAFMAERWLAYLKGDCGPSGGQKK